MSFFTGPTASFMVDESIVRGATFISGTYAMPNPPPRQSPLFGLPTFQASVGGQTIGALQGTSDTGFAFAAIREVVLPGVPPSSVRLTDEIAVSLSPLNTLTIPMGEVRVLAIPEPSSQALVMAGLAMLAFACRRTVGSLRR
jgi:hypothetical protein